MPSKSSHTRKYWPPNFSSMAILFRQEELIITWFFGILDQLGCPEANLKRFVSLLEWSSTVSVDSRLSDQCSIDLSSWPEYPVSGDGDLSVPVLKPLTKYFINHSFRSCASWYPRWNSYSNISISTWRTVQSHSISPPQSRPTIHRPPKWSAI